MRCIDSTDGAIMMLIVFVAFMIGAGILSCLLSSPVGDTAVEDTLVSVEDGVENHVLTAGINRQDEALAYIQEHDGTVISISYVSDGKKGTTTDLTIVWTRMTEAVE